MTETPFSHNIHPTIINLVESTSAFSPLLTEMPETLAIAHDEETKIRLLHIYAFAANFLGFIDTLLDEGTYDGFAVPFLACIAKKVTTIDIDPDILVKARNNNAVSNLINTGHVSILEMDACKLNFNQINKNSFDAVTIIEVFGAGFEGTEEDFKDVFNKAHEALKPGGTLIFTIKSKAAQHALKGIEWKGTSIDRNWLTNEALIYYTDINWHGQMSARNYANRIIERLETGNDRSSDYTVYEEKYFEDDKPMYWIGVCQKPQD